MKPLLSRWMIMTLPIIVLFVAILYGIALNSTAYSSARLFLATSPTIRQDLGIVQFEAILPFNIRFHVETHHEHELESKDGSASFVIVLFGSRSVGLASIAMAMKDDHWSVALCKLRRIGHTAEQIPN